MADDTKDQLTDRSGRMGFYESRFLDFAIAQKDDAKLELAARGNMLFIGAFAVFVVIAAILWA